MLSIPRPILIDCHYLFLHYAASYLLTERVGTTSEAIFIENNTTHAVPVLLDSLLQQGLTPNDVKYLIITHVHLDHAGGSSALIAQCPNAILLAHPRAARHLIDPSKLIRSARQVYGDAVFEKLYGQIRPIPAQRIRIMQDHETLTIGSRQLQFIYTEGHAKHHFCIYDSASNSIFTGDSFGLAYPSLQKNGLFIFPSTSPTDFDPTQARLSIQKILDSGADRAYLTHFGEVNQLQTAAKQLLRHLDYHETLLHEAMNSSDSVEILTIQIHDKLRNYFHTHLEALGLGSDHDAWELLKTDIQLNADGIVFTATKHRPPS